jgi:hypothetical protein
MGEYTARTMTLLEEKVMLHTLAAWYLGKRGGVRQVRADGYRRLWCPLRGSSEFANQVARQGKTKTWVPVQYVEEVIGRSSIRQF